MRAEWTQRTATKRRTAAHASSRPTGGPKRSELGNAHGQINEAKVAEEQLVMARMLWIATLLVGLASTADAVKASAAHPLESLAVTASSLAESAR
jgi:hypothetical protein